MSDALYELERRFVISERSATSCSCYRLVSALHDGAVRYFQHERRPHNAPIQPHRGPVAVSQTCITFSSPVLSTNEGLIA